jgi:hypothetical protein
MIMQRSKKILGLTLMSCVLVSMTGLAQTLQQKSQHQYSEKMVNDAVTDVNKKCESNLTAGFDWTGFDKLTPTDSQGNLGFQPGQFGRECLQGVYSVCDFNGADGKAAIKQKVQKLVVAYGGEGKRSLALSNGTLTYTIDTKVGTNRFCMEWLQQHM